MDNSKKDKKQKSKKEVEILDKKKQKLQKKESFREKKIKPSNLNLWVHYSVTPILYHNNSTLLSKIITSIYTSYIFHHSTCISFLH
jgi:hypothetical protein